MQLVNFNKTMVQAFDSLLSSNMTTLKQCYPSHYSNDKVVAFNECLKLYDQYNGYDGMKILGHNTFYFSIGFKGVYNNRKAFFYITSTNKRVAYLEK